VTRFSDTGGRPSKVQDFELSALTPQQAAEASGISHEQIRKAKRDAAATPQPAENTFHFPFAFSIAMAFGQHRLKSLGNQLQFQAWKIFHGSLIPISAV